MIWMDDGAAYHISKFITKFCRDTQDFYAWNGLRNLPYSTLSKTSGELLKYGLTGAVTEFRNVEEMKVAIQEEWERLTEEDFRKCIESTMPKRCKLVIKAKGGSIKY